MTYLPRVREQNIRSRRPQMFIEDEIVSLIHRSSIVGIPDKKVTLHWTMDCSTTSSEEFATVKDEGLYIPNYGRQSGVFVQSSRNIIDADSDDENEMSSATSLPTSFQLRVLVAALWDKKLPFRTRERRKFWVFTDGPQHREREKDIFGSRAAIEFSLGEGERPAQRRSN
ncbi:hypothetical protein TNCV_4659301 [Trichonephila clavipes]|nr:hypothetical protein TNCV_4659301 [Trichonephila clavipes]